MMKSPLRLLVTDPPTQHQLHDELVRSTIQPVADAELHIGLPAVVEHRKECLLLLIAGQKVPDGAVIRVVLDRGGPKLGEIVSDADCGGKIELIKSVERGVEDRIDDEIHRAGSPAVRPARLSD